jgi:glycosyltransferase involved in cell wall biosynthesis
LISLIVPTFNRGYALKEVLDTFFTQKSVTEIVFINDAGTDDTEEVIKNFSSKYPDTKVIYQKNSNRSGASYGRWKGVELSSNQYIMYCDDDEFLGPNYAHICMMKIVEGKASIVSGRHMYRNIGENYLETIKRFKNGLHHGRIFGKIRFKIYTDSIFNNDAYVPFTHGIFLTTKELLTTYPMDPFYSKGNGFREESDFQVNAFVNDKTILITNDCHCVHMNLKEVKTGGQRNPRILRYFWCVYYTNYFLKKYFAKLKYKLEIPYNLPIAMFLYASSEFYDFFLRPFVIVWKRIT